MTTWHGIFRDTVCQMEDEIMCGMEIKGNLPFVGRKLRRSKLLVEVDLDETIVYEGIESNLQLWNWTLGSFERSVTFQS